MSHEPARDIGIFHIVHHNRTEHVAQILAGYFHTALILLGLHRLHHLQRCQLRVRLSVADPCRLDQVAGVLVVGRGDLVDQVRAVAGRGEYSGRKPGILKPEPVTGWRATDPNCRHVSPRRWALGDLIVKLNGFSWKEYLHIYPAPKPVARFVVHYLEREQVINCGMPEIDSEKFSIYESVSFGGNTTRKEFLRIGLYRIIYTALKTGEISRLRLCEYGKCQNFFCWPGKALQREVQDHIL